MTGARVIVACAAIIVIAGLAAHVNGVNDQFVGFNAQRSLVDNPDIRSIVPLYRSTSLHLAGEAARADGGPFVRRPVLSLSFALNHAVTGTSAAGFQVVNLAIHLIAALLLFGLVRRTLRAPTVAGRWSEASTGIATAVAVLWVVHPLTTESVTYVIQRGESLASMFALATLYAFGRYCESPTQRRWAVIAVVCCVLAMATKESVAALPLLVWTYDALFFAGTFTASLKQRRALLAGLAAAWLVPAVLVARTLPDVQVDFRPGRALPYLLAQPRVILEYVRLSFWPDTLHLYSNTARFTDPNLSTIVAAGGAVVAASLLTVYGIARRWPVAFLPASFFLLLAPTSSVIATNDVIQEHRAYLAMAALVVAAVLGLTVLVRAGVADVWMRRRLLLAIVAVAAVALGVRTHVRNQAWRGEFSAFYPADLAMAHGALARHASAANRLEEAAERFRILLALPDSAFGSGPVERRYHRGRAHNDFGAVLAELGRLDEAAQQFDAAIATGYDLPAARNNRAVIRALHGDAASATSTLRDLRVAPEKTAWLQNNLGAVLAARGESDAANRALAEAIAAEPRLELARKNRELVGEDVGLELHRLRDYDDAWLFLKLVRRGNAESSRIQANVALRSAVPAARWSLVGVRSAAGTAGPTPSNERGQSPLNGTVPHPASRRARRARRRGASFRGHRSSRD